MSGSNLGRVCGVRAESAAALADVARDAAEVEAVPEEDDAEVCVPAA